MKLLTSLILSTLIFMGPISTIHAEDGAIKTPTGRSSEQWQVTITQGEPLGRESIKQYHTFSLLAENIGPDIENVTLDVYRPVEKDNTLKLGWLFPTMSGEGVFKKNQTINMRNFPLGDDASFIEVVITWKEQGKDRRFKESFYFNKNEKRS